MTGSRLVGQDSTLSRNLPVCEFSAFAICSGVPLATTSPPSFPASGPRSTIQSAHLITSRLCSITTTECPPSPSPSSNPTSTPTSPKPTPPLAPPPTPHSPTPPPHTPPPPTPPHP